MMHRFQHWFSGLAILSSVLLVIASAACTANTAPQIVNRATQSSLQSSDIQSMASADVVYLGEHHDSEADHAAQLEILEAIYAENPNLAIALEMFQRPFQAVIDRYLAGQISEAELVEQTEYEQRWGFPWAYYAPILRFAKAHQLPVLALNAPSEVVSQVAQDGLDSLEDDDFRYIPPLNDIDTSNTDYQAFVRRAFVAHSPHSDSNFEDFFAAQVLWDETMAETIANFKRASPNTTIVVLAGQGHVVYGYGIPSRVARRLHPRLRQVKVLINVSPETLTDAEAGMADILWYSE